MSYNRVDVSVFQKAKKVITTVETVTFIRKQKMSSSALLQTVWEAVNLLRNPLKSLLI